MADRYCGNCGQELGADNRFCPGCGRPVHETAIVPTPEADISVPPPLAAEVEDFTVKGSGVRTTVIAVAVTVLILALLGGLASGNNGTVTVSFILLIVVFIAATAKRQGWVQEEDRGLVRPGAEMPVPEVGRTSQLDEEIGGLLRRGFLVQYRTPTTAQLVKPKHFSFIWALLWFLVFGIGIIVYLIYYAAKRDHGVYLAVDEYGAVRATWQ